MKHEAYSTMETASHLTIRIFIIDYNVHKDIKSPGTSCSILHFAFCTQHLAILQHVEVQYCIHYYLINLTILPCQPGLLFSNRIM